VSSQIMCASMAVIVIMYGCVYCRMHHGCFTKT